MPKRKGQDYRTGLCRSVYKVLYAGWDCKAFPYLD